MEQLNKSLVLKTSETIQAPASEVWQAIVDPELVKKYFFGTNVKSDWKKGSTITFSGEWEGKPYEDKGIILDIIENKLLKYTYWSNMSGTEDKPENYATVTYELTEKNGSTVYTVSQNNLASQEALEHSEKNWKYLLGEIKKLLEK